MHFVISDIHGELDKLKNLLAKIHFSEQDELYVLGDVVDRGPNPIKALQYLMKLSNVTCIVGNHEYMAMTCLEILQNEITDQFLDHLSVEEYGKLVEWMMNGADTTIKEFAALTTEERLDILDFMGEFLAYEEVRVNGTDYLLVHAGINHFQKEKALDEYSLEDFIWTRINYDIPYYSHKYVVSGHTPTQFIPNNVRPGYIYQKNNHIALDCGAHIEGGHLAAFCLETGEEFYS